MTATVDILEHQYLTSYLLNTVPVGTSFLFFFCYVNIFLNLVFKKLILVVFFTIKGVDKSDVMI